MATTVKNETTTETTTENKAAELRKKFTKSIQIEDDLTVDVYFNPTDFKFMRQFDKFMDFNKKINGKGLSEKESMELVHVVFTIIKIMIDEYDMEEIEEYYTEKYGEFGIDKMQNFLSKCFDQNSKK